jgi:hypothetical protein
MSASFDSYDIANNLGVKRGFALAQNGFTLADSKFSYVDLNEKDKGKFSDVLNNKVKWKESNTDPCELSIKLLQRLRELLKSHFQSSNYRTPDGFTKVPLSHNSFEVVRTSSAFHVFEIEACELQKVDLFELNLAERTVFFVNVHNCLILHGAIAQVTKTGAGTNLYERTLFMRAVKYNIGGHVYSVLDIEHGILRASSANPMVFGPFSASLTFSERDPRYPFRLTEPVPNVTFCLFSICMTSPVLCILQETDNKKKFNEKHKPERSKHESELEHYAALFIRQHVRLDVDKKLLELPDILRIYTKDFGGDKSSVVRFARRKHTKEFAEKVAKLQPKVTFISVDWTPALIM